MNQGLQIKQFTKVLLIFFLVILGLVLLLNAPYLWTRLRFTLHHQNPTDVLKSIAKPDQLEKDKGAWQPNTLAIPSLGVVAPIQYATTTVEADFQKLLQKGVVHYPKTALAGEVGNMFLFGHSSDYAWSGGDFKTVLALLPKLQKGEEIKVVDERGYLYTYIAKQIEVVVPSDTRWLSQDTKGKKLLTVQTSYPIGTALKRYLVIAELKESD